MKVPTNAYTIKDLLRHYTKWAFHKCFLLLFAVAVSQEAGPTVAARLYCEQQTISLVL